MRQGIISLIFLLYFLASPALAVNLPCAEKWQRDLLSCESSYQGKIHYLDVINEVLGGRFHLIVMDPFGASPSDTFAGYTEDHNKTSSIDSLYLSSSADSLQEGVDGRSKPYGFLKLY